MRMLWRSTNYPFHQYAVILGNICPRIQNFSARRAAGTTGPHRDRLLLLLLRAALHLGARRAVRAHEPEPPAPLRALPPRRLPHFPLRPVPCRQNHPVHASPVAAATQRGAGHVPHVPGGPAAVRRSHLQRVQRDAARYHEADRGVPCEGHQRLLFTD